MPSLGITATGPSDGLLSGVGAHDVMGGGLGGEGSTGVRLIGGRPLGLTLASAPPGFHAEDTFLGPRLWVESLGLDGEMADRGSNASSQKELLVEGVMAELGYRESGVCTESLKPQATAAPGLEGSIGTPWARASG